VGSGGFFVFRLLWVYRFSTEENEENFSLLALQFPLGLFVKLNCC
jgi:hypothetical protein